MPQQVNFYQPQFRERPVPLPSGMLLQAVGAVFLAMLMIYAFATNRVTAVATEMQVIEAQEAAAVERLGNLRATIRSVIGEKSWAERLDEATRELDEREESLRLISGTALGDADGFSRHLEALARQSMDGLWLTQISLSAKGDRTWLQGESRRADLVPLYLQNLADEQPFAKQRFYRLNINRDEDETRNTLAFVVTSDSTFASTGAGRR